MNQLAEKSTSIVTDQAGTTRDLIRERLSIGGLPVELVDTAGLRESDDKIEQEGVRRATEEIRSADRVLLVVDDSLPCDESTSIQQFRENTRSELPVTLVRNKSDVSGRRVSRSKARRAMTQC